MASQRRKTPTRSATPLTNAALFVVEAFPPLPQTSRLALDTVLTADPHEVGTARRRLTGVISEYELDDIYDSAALCVSELVTNSIQHTSTSEVGLKAEVWETGICLLITDCSPAPPRPRPDGLNNTTRASGRGLALVSKLSQDWGYFHSAEGGKTVWCSLSTSDNYAAAMAS